MNTGSISRRAVLLGTLGAIAGCSGTSKPAPQPPGTTSAHTTSPAPTASPTPTHAALPAYPLWTPGAGELDPQVKARAVTLIGQLAAWPNAGQGLAAARNRIAALGYDPALAGQATELLANAPQASMRVIDAQYGGLLDTSASVLVVTDQWLLGADGRITAGGATIDVRLEQATPQWRVTELHPSVPGPPVTVSAAANAVLTNDRIHLPPAGAADIRSGNVHDSVLQALQELSTEHVLDVSVVRSGHPIYVFGTDRLSDHPRGRAVDIWAIDGHAVVNPQTSTSLVDGLMRRAAALGSYNVGGPRLLSGSQFFSDNTHHDHVHLGFLS